MTNPVKAIQKYYFETVTELKKCTWPTKHELYESTVLVISSTILLTVFVWIADHIIEFGVRYLTGGI